MVFGVTEKEIMSNQKHHYAITEISVSPQTVQAPLVLPSEDFCSRIGEDSWQGNKCN